MSVVSGVMGREEEDPLMVEILDRIESLLTDDELAYLCWRAAAIYGRENRGEKSATTH